MAVILEPQKRRDKTDPQAFIIDTDAFCLTQDDYYKYVLKKKQKFTLSLITQIINDNPQGIIQREIICQIQQIYKNKRVGDNGIYYLLGIFDGKLFKSFKGDDYNKKSISHYSLL